MESNSELEENESELEESESELRKGGGAEGGGGHKVLSDAEAIASEVLTNRELLTIFLMLGLRPRAARELTMVKLYDLEKRTAKDSYGRVEERWEIVERWMPDTTAYKLLKKLSEAGLAEAHRGIDGRKKIYKLTGLGESVYEKTIEIIRRIVIPHMKRPEELLEELEAEEYLEKHREALEGVRALTLEDFRRTIARLLGVDPEAVITAINAEKISVGGKTIVIVRE